MPIDPKTAKIIIADDHESMRNALTNLLLAMGFVPENINATAIKGEDVLSLLKQQPADLLLTDYNMASILSGAELIRIIKANPPHGKPPFMVLLSAYINDPAEADRKTAAIKAGADAIIDKSEAGMPEKLLQILGL